jgi:hypothetical protein
VTCAAVVVEFQRGSTLRVVVDKSLLISLYKPAICTHVAHSSLLLLRMR